MEYALNTNDFFFHRKVVDKLKKFPPTGLFIKIVYLWKGDWKKGFKPAIKDAFDVLGKNYWYTLFKIV